MANRLINNMFINDDVEIDDEEEFEEYDVEDSSDDDEEEVEEEEEEEEREDVNELDEVEEGTDFPPSSDATTSRGLEIEEMDKDLTKLNQDSKATTSISGECNEGEGSQKEWDREDVDGAFCPICMEPWTSSGEHQPRYLLFILLCVLQLGLYKLIVFQFVFDRIVF